MISTIQKKYNNFQKKYPLILNKYILIFMFFTIWMLFFDVNCYKQHLSYNAEIERIKTQIKFYKGEIKINKEKLSNLKNNPKEIERLAREKYWMKKDNEDIFIIQQN